MSDRPLGEDRWHRFPCNRFCLNGRESVVMVSHFLPALFEFFSSEQEKGGVRGRRLNILRIFVSIVKHW